MTDKYLNKIYNSDSEVEKTSYTLEFIFKLISAVDPKENVGLNNYLLNLQQLLSSPSESTVKNNAVDGFVAICVRYKNYFDEELKEYEDEMKQIEYAIKNNIYYKSKRSKLREFGDRIESIEKKDDKFLYVAELMDRIIKKISSRLDNEDNEDLLMTLLLIKDYKEQLLVSTKSEMDFVIGQFISLYWNMYDVIEDSNEITSSTLSNI